MPNARNSSGPVLNEPLRQLSDMSATNWLTPMFPSSLSWPSDGLKNLTTLATQSFSATYSLWFELLENQRRLLARLLGAAVGLSTPMTTSPRVSIPPPSGSTTDTRASGRGEQRAESITDSVASVIDDSTRRSRRAAPSTSTAFPIKRYDELTVPEIVGKLERLRDRDQLLLVLAHEAKLKARKGVAAAGKARLQQLAD